MVGSSLIPKATPAVLSQKNEFLSPTLKPFAKDLFNGLASLKFVAYAGSDGFPVLVPVIHFS